MNRLKAHAELIRQSNVFYEGGRPYFRPHIANNASISFPTGVHPECNFMLARTIGPRNKISDLDFDIIVALASDIGKLKLIRDVRAPKCLTLSH